MTAETNVQNLPLSAIDTGDGFDEYQPRGAGIDRRHVRLLMATEPAEWPAIVVKPHGEKYRIVVGFHRVAAATRLGLESIQAIVDPNATYATAYESNVRHGLPLTLTDRKDYARWLAENEPALSLREVGRRCGLSHNTVKAALEEGERAGSAGQSDQPDPLIRLVRLVEKAVSDGAGVNALKFWQDKQDQRAAAVLRILNERQADQKTIEGIKSLGAALVTAAGQYKG